jgi:methyl-accepting chemotaxis protein
VIVPLSKTKNEINEIIDGIDRREGDLTKRVTIMSNQEVAAVGSGINLFMGKLQDIFKTIIHNSKRMETVTGMHVLHLVIRWQQAIHPDRIFRKLWIYLLMVSRHPRLNK